MRDCKTRSDVIGVVGLGYIGLPLLATFANVGFKAVGLDVNETTINRLRNGDSPHFYEPGLAATLSRCRSNIEYTNCYEDFMKRCDVIFITVGTPINEKDEPDYSYMDLAVNNIGAGLRKGQLVVLKSTVVPGTTREVALRLEKMSGMKAGKDFFISFCPERTIEGIALYELYNLPKIIGGINEESTERTAVVISKLGDKVVRVSSADVAEMCKLIDNLFRAFNIGFANELGMLCEKMGIDSYELVNAVNSAYERTNVFKPGLGADGPCLSKDPMILRHFARKNNLETYILDSCIKINKVSTMRLVDLCVSFIRKHDIKNPKIALIGLAFKGKPETDDLRGSPSIKIFKGIENSLKEYADIACRYSFYDPIVSRFEESDVADNYHDAIRGSNVVMFLTDHQSIKNIDMREIESIADRPLFIIDAWHNVRREVDCAVGNDTAYFRVGDGK